MKIEATTVLQILASQKKNNPTRSRVLKGFNFSSLIPRSTFNNVGSMMGMDLEWTRNRFHSI